MKYLLWLFPAACWISILAVSGQPVRYTVSNAHSHNDYQQPFPFRQAYERQFGSIETDIHLVGTQILVAHDTSELSTARTLEQLYLLPLAGVINDNNGYVYADSSLQLQLMIDVKTDSFKTLEALIILLNRYPGIITNHSVRIIITGNRPATEHYSKYPSYIWFDGRLGQSYSRSALARIALLSENFARYSKWKGAGPISQAEHAHLTTLVQKGHQLKKPVRFWAIPDGPEGWNEMIRLKVDYINTDRIPALSDFLKQRNQSTELPAKQHP